MNNSASAETTAEIASEFQGKSEIYYGPTLRGGQLLQFTTFRNGLPKNVNGLIKRIPMLASAIVDISEFPRVMQALNDKNSPESAIVRALKGAV